MEQLSTNGLNKILRLFGYKLFKNCTGICFVFVGPRIVLISTYNFVPDLQEQKYNVISSNSHLNFLMCKTRNNIKKKQKPVIELRCFRDRFGIILGNIRNLQRKLGQQTMFFLIINANTTVIQQQNL